MKIVLWAAAAATILMSLMNLPIAFMADEQGIPIVLAVLVSLLGVIGIVAAVGLLRRADWGKPAVVAVASLNLVGAVIALVADSEGAAIGLVVSLVGLALGVLTRDGDTAPAPSRA